MAVPEAARCHRAVTAPAGSQRARSWRHFWQGFGAVNSAWWFIPRNPALPQARSSRPGASRHLAEPPGNPAGIQIGAWMGAQTCSRRAKGNVGTKTPKQSWVWGKKTCIWVRQSPGAAAGAGEVKAGAGRQSHQEFVFICLHSA